MSDRAHLSPLAFRLLHIPGASSQRVSSTTLARLTGYSAGECERARRELRTYRQRVA